MAILKETISLFIPGDPIAKARPRFVRAGEHVRTYSTQHTVEGRFMWDVLYQLDQLPFYKKEPFEGALSLHMGFFFKRPKGHYGSGKNAGVLKKSAPRHHTVKIDVDNAIKFVMDCFNQIIYLDDKQVVEVYAIKRYVEGVGRAGTEVVIESYP